MGFTRRHQDIYIESKRKKNDRYYKTKRAIRRSQHQKRRERELAENKEYYQKNKLYFRTKNREYNQKNAEKWAKRRREIANEWQFNTCTPSFVENTFNSLGASITTDGNITFSQLCGLIEALGYSIKEVTYLPFIRRKNYFNKKRTP